MVLTGNALQDFIKWSSTDNGYIYVNKSTSTTIHYTLLTDDILNALIIEWFDSVGIYIQIQTLKTPISHNIYFEYLIKNDKPLMSDYYKTRKEATKQAIIKANEIYNNQNK